MKTFDRFPVFVYTLVLNQLSSVFTGTPLSVYLLLFFFANDNATSRETMMTNGLIIVFMGYFVIPYLFAFCIMLLFDKIKKNLSEHAVKRLETITRFCFNFFTVVFFLLSFFFLLWKKEF